MKKIVLKLMVSIYNLKENYYNRIYQYKLRNNAGVKIANNVRVLKSALVEIRFGGSIEIDENTEVLDGVMILTYGGAIKIGKRSS